MRYGEGKWGCAAWEGFGLCCSAPFRVRGVGELGCVVAHPKGCATGRNIGVRGGKGKLGCATARAMSLPLSKPRPCPETIFPFPSPPCRGIIARGCAARHLAAQRFSRTEVESRENNGFRRRGMRVPSLRRMRSSTGATRPPHDGEGDDGGVSHVHGRRKGRDRGQDLRRDIGDHRAALARAPSFKRRRADTA